MIANMKSPDVPGDPIWPTLKAEVRRHVLATCQKFDWDLVLVSRALGVSLKTVYNHLNRYKKQGIVTHGPPPKYWSLTSPGDSKKAVSTQHLLR